METLGEYENHNEFLIHLIFNLVIISQKSFYIIKHLLEFDLFIF